MTPEGEDKKLPSSQSDEKKTKGGGQVARYRERVPSTGKRV